MAKLKIKKNISKNKSASKNKKKVPITQDISKEELNYYMEKINAI